MQPTYDDQQYKKNRENLVLNYYLAIYKELLPDEKKTSVQCKEPFNIGYKNVYALSDIEGNNLNFLDFLQKLGLVQYRTNKPPTNNKEWIECYTKEDHGIVWYKFNETACRAFKNVIVLCGDCIGHEDLIRSKGTVEILKKLNQLLNNNGKAEDGNKRLFLVAGNHDIFDHGETSLNPLKEEVFNLGLYPQLMLMNGYGQRLLFQHTNFPYIEKQNIIRNKTININKAKIILKKSFEKPNSSILFNNDGYFLLRCKIKSDGPHYTPTTGPGQLAVELDRNIYSDHGIGYDKKFVGHDPQQTNMYNRLNGLGDVVNCHIANKNPQLVCHPCPALVKDVRKPIGAHPKLYQHIYSALNSLFNGIVTKEKTRNKFCKDICDELLSKKYF